MRRAASIVSLVLLFVAVQPSVAKVVVDAKPSAVSLSVPDRAVSLIVPPSDRSTAAHPSLPSSNIANDPLPFVTEFYGPINKAAKADAEPKRDWKSKRIAQMRSAWNKVVKFFF